MLEPGPLISSGRDADIFAFGDGLVLRRTTTGRSLEAEARIMEYVAAAGFPVPRVVELRAGATEMVMERVDGGTMLEALAARPWTVRRQGAVLARLHLQLHEIAAPAWLPAFDAAPGDRVGHFDLHPLNVMMSAHGPVLIDWTNAAATRPAADVALSWAVMAAAQVESGAARQLLARVARRALVAGLLASFDRREVAAELAAVVGYKSHDPHLSSVEVARARALVAREAAR